MFVSIILNESNVLRKEVDKTDRKKQAKRKDGQTDMYTGPLHSTERIFKTIQKFFSANYIF